MRNPDRVAGVQPSFGGELAPPDWEDYARRMPEIEQWGARSEAIRAALEETLEAHEGAVTHEEWEAHMERWRERNEERT